MDIAHAYPQEESSIRSLTEDIISQGDAGQQNWSSDNVWPQSKYANQYLNGDTLNYRDNLIRKIGLDRVERLENLQRAWQGSDVVI